MKRYIIILCALLLVKVACGESAQQEAPAQKSQTTIPVGKGPDALFLTPDESHLYVANVEDSFISVIDTRKDEVVQTIDGTDYPWGFTRLGESNLVAVSGWDKGVDVIDFTTHKIVRSKRYDHQLGGVTSTKDGTTLFVVATDANQVLKINAQTLEIEDAYPTGKGPDGVGISKDETKLYVTNTEDGTISIIDVKTKETTLLEVGHKPELIHANHDRSLLFISNFFGNKVHIIDASAGKIIREITGLDGPEEAVPSKSGDRLFVVNFNNSKVYVYDARTYEKLPQEFTVGSKPIGLVHAAQANKLYVSNYGDNSVSLIELDAKRSAATVEGTSREILVKFKPGVQAEQVRSMAEEIGLQEVKAMPQLSLRVFRITSQKSLEQAIAACQKQPFVEYAEPNQEYRTQK